jgi:HlyD family secretion protein
MRSTPTLRPLPRSVSRPFLTGTRAWVIVLGLLALILLALIGRETLFAKPAAVTLRLGTVTRGTVTAQVSGTGSLVPAGQVNVNFRVSGQLTEIDVKVGDHVTSGQVLARLDATSQQAALSQAQASLASAQASLQAALTPLTAAQVAQLQHSLSAAQQNYTDTVNAVGWQNQMDATTVQTDQQNYADTVNSVNAQNQVDATTVQNDSQQLSADQAKFSSDGCTSGSTAPPCPADQASVTRDQAQLSSDLSRQHLDDLSGQSRINQASAAVTAAQQRLASDQGSGQARINQAAAQVTSAQDNLAVQTQSRPNTIASARAQVASAQAQVLSAQLALNQTTLTAPSSGVVAGINGVVGETAASGGGTTAQAPGTTAPQPASNTSSASTGAFMVITDTSSFDAVIPFAETDGARLASDQEASLTFDAVPGLTVSGHVLRVGPNATVSSSVVNYSVTFVLNRTDPRLKAGMTTNATVTVAQASNVLLVPNAAVQTVSGTPMVTVYSGGQQVSTEVEPGLVGDTTTEIKGGLKEGDRVVLPTPRLSGASSRSGTGRGGGGGIPVFRGGGG